MPKNILLIGRNPTVLTNLASALTEEGFAVKTTNLVEQSSQDFNAADFDVIAFGRGVDVATNAQLKASFSDQNPAILFVDGLAPVIPLLIKQIHLALTDEPTAKKILIDFSYEQADSLQIHITTTASCRLTVDLYQLDAVHHTRQKTLVSELVRAGSHTFQLTNLPDTKLTINFLVAEAHNLDVAVLPLQ